MVVQAKNSLIEKKEKEDIEYKELIKIGKNISEFFRDYAKSLYKFDINTKFSEGGWTDEENNKIKVNIIENNINITWSKKSVFFEGDDDNYIISGKIDNNGCNIIFEYPITISSGLLNLYPLIPPYKEPKPNRVIEKYEGYCSFDIEKGLLTILYIKNKNIEFKKIKRISNA